MMCITRASDDADALSTDEPNDEGKSPDFATYLAQVLGVVCAVWDSYPSICTCVAQIVVITLVLLLIACCCSRPMRQRSTVHIDLDSESDVSVQVARAFPSLKKIPEVDGHGSPIPGTPARPLDCSSESASSTFSSTASGNAAPQTPAMPREHSDAASSSDAVPITHHQPLEQVIAPLDPNQRAAQRGARSKARARPTTPVMVWIATSQGSKYHTPRSCKALRQSTRVSELTRANAVVRGYTPCNICKPA